jgi:hypothetical protein
MKWSVSYPAFSNRQDRAIANLRNAQNSEFPNVGRQEVEDRGLNSNNLYIISNNRYRWCREHFFLLRRYEDFPSAWVAT